MENKILNNGVEIPAIGFGTYRSTDGTKDVLQNALNAGYRFFDTASFYKNETDIGEVIKASGIKREEIFLTSKCWRTEMGYEKALESFENSCKRLQTNYLDMYLIHWPRPNLTDPDWKRISIDTWKALEYLYENKRVRVIGVSNFLPHHLDNLLSESKIVPAVNQIEFHPGYMQKEVLDYCREKGIQVEAWSPLGCSRLFENTLLKEMAKKYEISVAQLCLRFAIQENVIPLPKSSSYERMQQNLDVFDIKILEEDMQLLENMPQAGWSGEHPDRERDKSVTA